MSIDTTMPAATHNPSADEYRSFIRAQYDGPAGALTAFTGLVTGHGALAGRLIRPDAFDVRGCRRLLDAACGDGRYSEYLLRESDPEATLTVFDLSEQMVRRAARRLRSDRAFYVVADLTHLPYADGTFDAAVCGWAMEHFADPGDGLRELARVLAPGGKLLLLTTEDTVPGRLCSWLWHCRTYGRRELRAACAECGLLWHRELWFTGVHRLLGLGGVVVELRRQEDADG